MSDISFIREACNSLEEYLEISTPMEEKVDAIENHIRLMEENPVCFPKFNADFQWINVSRPLNLLTDLKGKIVVLDFFTYCCINCLHILPLLKSMEKSFSVEDGVVVIGVHSGKFDNEKILDNIKNAVLRYDIHHPVVNDSQGIIWSNLGILCWPTIVILGPNNELLFELIGEQSYQKVELLVRTTLNHFYSQNTISKHSLPVMLLENFVSFQMLSFPSKISLDHDHGTNLAISDTGHHRILILTRSGCILHIIGGVNPGMADGDFENARFHSPQGVTWFTLDKLYVADTNNHAIREIDLITKKVTTVAGTGNLGSDKEGGLLGTNQALNSPWDVCMGSGIDGNEKCVLYIAMAGHHQIWALFFKDTIWLKNVKYSAGTCVAIAGTGNEENRNNAYPHRASFAQPSGLCFISDNTNGALIIADSESSTIRKMSLKDGGVKGIVGGSQDPSNLFAFGDEDGTGVDAKLQHPLGVTGLANERLLYVCDSYNHKIKVIDVISKTCYTFAGRGIPGDNISSDLLTSEFNEPNGLVLCPSTSEIFIADTNNHSVKVINIINKSVTKLNVFWDGSDHLMQEQITMVDGPSSCSKSKYHHEKQLEPIYVSPDGTILLTFDLQLKEGHHLTPDAPQTWSILSKETNKLFETENNQKFGNLSSLTDQSTIRIFPKSGNYNQLNVAFSVEIEACIYFCSDNDVCFMRNILFNVPVIVSSNASPTCEAILSHCLSP